MCSRGQVPDESGVTVGLAGYKGVDASCEQIVNKFAVRVGSNRLKMCG